MTQATNVETFLAPTGAMLRLDGRFQAEDGSEHPCTSRRFGDGLAEIESSTMAAVGESILIYMDGIGSFQAVVSGRTPGGMEVRLAGTPVRKGKVTARVAWLIGNVGVTIENRGSRRVTPRNPDTTVVLRGEHVRTRLVDVSMSGASLSWEGDAPAVDEPITVGLRRATVVRHTEDGFAVRFAMPLPAHSLDEGIVL